MSHPGEPTAFSFGPSSVPLPGVTLGGVIAGKYRVERVIGRGGMGLVVAATHLQLERTVAIKLIRDEYIEDPLVVERLVREARAAASIQSQHVARVLDVGTLDNGAPFIVMEYLEGQDLDSLLQSDGPLQVGEAVDFLLQACEAIAEAHFNHIVHRDLKPANLFVAHQPGGGRCVKVVDFGISKLMYLGAGESITDPSRMMGSLYHMAPEQISGDPVDARTDVWALGVLLFEMLTGRKPFRPGAWPAVCNQIVNESSPDLAVLQAEVPQELRQAIGRCLRRAPAERYPNVAELAVELLPFGSRRARHSLERIVRLATATGSLSAEVLFPDTPKPAAREEAPPPSEPAASRTAPEPARGTSRGPLRQRPLWALGLLMGCGLVVFLAAYLSGGERRPLALEELSPLTPVEPTPAPRQQPRAAPQLPSPVAPHAESDTVALPVVTPPVAAPTSAERQDAIPRVTPQVPARPSPRVALLSPTSPPPAAVVPPTPASRPPPAAQRSDAPSKEAPPEPAKTETAKGESVASREPAEPRSQPEPLAPPARPDSAAPPARPDSAAPPARGNPWNLRDVGYR